MDNLRFAHGGNVYEIKRKCGTEVIDFSANVNPLRSSLLKAGFSQGYEGIFHYPDPQANDLIKKIAKYWGVNEENILVGNGSTQLIYLLVHTLMPKSVLIPAPSFSEFERAAESVKAEVRFLALREENRWTLELPVLEKVAPLTEVALPSPADILFISNPNNPTGNLLLTNKRLDGVSCPLVVIDEAFMDFVPEEKDYTFIWKAVENKRMAVLRSFTKFFALPGLRIGYLIAHQDLIGRLKAAQPPWSVNAIAQSLAGIILNDNDYIKETQRVIEEERVFLFNELAKIDGLKPYPSVANFMLIKITNEEVNSRILTERLIIKGILIRNCGNFRGLNNKFIRIAILSHDENMKLITCLRRLL
ncbi:MAG: threonine-phosphate decarboxylase CobD [bacterium]|nr:threonine-phosphate decarboxylase CobD [bacterium]